MKLINALCRLLNFKSKLFQVINYHIDYENASNVKNSSTVLQNRKKDRLTKRSK